MKKLLLMAVAAFTIAFTANAQTQRQSDPSQKEVREQSRKSQFANLEMTQAQKDQMKKMREENQIQRDAIKNDKSLTEAQKSEKMKALHKSHKDGMNSILTQEQKEKMKTQMKNNPSQKGVREHNRKSQHANLDLTQAQKDQMKKMREENKVQRDAIKNDQNLTEAQKSEKMKALHKSHKDGMSTILTKEQKEKMKTQRQDHKMKGKKMHQQKMNRTPDAS